MRVLHKIDNFNVGGIQDLILNLHKYDRWNSHAVWCYNGSLSAEAVDNGMIVLEGGPTPDDKYDVLVGHGVGGWSYNDTFQWAKDRDMKTVEMMHSVARSLTDPSMSDAFVGVSDMVSGANQHMRNVRTIYPIVPHTLFSVSSHGNMIGRISRLAEEKRPWEFVQIVDRFPDEKFIMAGDGSARDKLWDSRYNLTMPGMLRDFPPFFEKLKLFVFPTRDEANSVSVAMALAAGIPAIVQDIPQLRETTGGWVRFENTHDEFVNAISEFLTLTDQDRYHKWTLMAANARAWAYSHFYPTEIVAKWRMLLNSL